MSFAHGQVFMDPETPSLKLKSNTILPYLSICLTLNFEIVKYQENQTQDYIHKQLRIMFYIAFGALMLATIITIFQG